MTQTKYESRTNPQFRKLLKELPEQARKQARQTYQLFRENPAHPGLHFKPVHPTKPVYSARVGLDYRVVGMKHLDKIIWFWIGSHADYDRIIENL